MKINRAAVLIALVFASGFSVQSRAENVPDSEIKKLREEVKTITELREELKTLTDKYNAMQSTAKSATPAAADAALEKKFGPNAKVISKFGNLELGGLLQAWYYTVQHDKQGLFSNPGTGIVDSNAAGNTDSFRIRRAELKFKMDITQNVSSFIMIDPANEATAFPQLAVGAHRLAQVSPEYLAANPGILGASTSSIAGIQTGAGTTNRLLQDALINFHGIVPHHDFTVGQMLPSFNEESLANDGALEFIERSYIGNSASRDLGAVIHGSWFCNGDGGVYQGLGDSGRLQYWLGMYNGSANLLGTSGSSANRSDTNDQKDFVATLLVRPLWDDCRGKMELGYSFRAGHHGNSGPGSAAPGAGGVGTGDGFIAANTSSLGHDVWAKYSAPGRLKGLWLKGEATWLHDRNAPLSVIDLANADFQLGNGLGGVTGIAEPVSTFGYWGAIGYKLADCPTSRCGCGAGNEIWRNFEFAFRYERAPNIMVAKPNASFTSVYSSTVYTAGVNYYIQGDNAKLQLNYNDVQTPDGPNGQRFHKTHHNSLVLSFQVMW